MLNGRTDFPEISEWQVFKCDILINKFYRDSTVQDIFISELFEKAQRDEKEMQRLKAFAGLPSSCFQSSEEIWNNHYKPLFYTMYHIKTLVEKRDALINELKRLKHLDLPTNEMIDNSLTMQADLVCQYVKEEYDFKCSLKDVKNNKGMIETVKKNLSSLKIDQNLW